MLATQISYWDLQEKKRHNLATEGQTTIELNRKQKEYELAYDKTQKELDIARANLNEAIRHNKVAEGNDKVKATAALKQAKAAMQQAEIAAFNAQTNLEAVQSQIKLNESQIGVNKTVQSLNQSNVALNWAKRRNVEASTSKVKTETAKTKAETSKVKQDTKKSKAETGKAVSEANLNDARKSVVTKEDRFYVVNNVVPNMTKSFRDVAGGINDLVPIM